MWVISLTDPGVDLAGGFARICAGVLPLDIIRVLAVGVRKCAVCAWFARIPYGLAIVGTVARVMGPCHTRLGWATTAWMCASHWARISRSSRGWWCGSIFVELGSRFPVELEVVSEKWFAVIVLSAIYFSLRAPRCASDRVGSILRNA